MAKPFSRNGHDDTPLSPHSFDAEAGVIGCCLLAPASCIDEAREVIKSSKWFFDVRNATIWESLVRMAHEDVESIDEVTLQQDLRKRGMLDDCGGREYISTLPDAAPSAKNLDYWLDIVEEKYQLRHYAQTCASVAGRILEHSGEANGLLDEIEHDLRKLFAPKFDEDEAWTFDQLKGYDVKNDPNCLIGLKNGQTSRYLCKGHACWIIAPSGVGKSVFSTQVGMTFAIGQGFCGILPIGPLKTLVVQGENDQGDCAEAIQGIAKHLGIEDFSGQEDLIQKNLKIVRPIGKINKSFCVWLEKKIVEFGAQLVIIDPLLSFAGIDISRQAECSQFLRVFLGPVLHRTGSVLIAVHHTGKPQRDGKGDKPKTLLQYAYDGIGSSELVNWARAVIIIDQVADDSTFRVMLSKRGGRAGATHPSENGEPGEPAQVLWMRHATDGNLYWQQIPPPVEPEPTEDDHQKGRPSVVAEVAASNLFAFCAGCKEQGEALKAICARLEAWLATQRRDVSKSTCKKIIAALVANAKLRKADDRYFKGDEA